MGVQCKSVGVPLAEVHAGGAGAPSRAPAEEAAASLTGADCGHLSDGDLTWLPGHEPGGGQEMAESEKASKQNYETTFKNVSSSEAVTHRAAPQLWSTVNPYLCDLPQGICGWDSLVAVEAVALDGVRALWRRVAWRHVGWGRCRQGA